MKFNRLLVPSLLCFSLLITGISCRETVEVTEPIPGQISEVNHFQEAINAAMTAGQLTQEADRVQAWEIVAQHWQAALDNLALVPDSDPNYSLAQEKIVEYQKNLEYANQNLLDEKLLEALLGNNANLDEVRALISQGANPRRVSNNMFDDKVLVLYYAVRSHSDEKVKIMLESGATWNQLSQEQLNDALIGASCDGYLFTVEELLNAGADPNSSNRHNETPLLLAQDATCRTVDGNGGRIVDERQHNEVANLLREKGALQ